MVSVGSLAIFTAKGCDTSETIRGMHLVQANREHLASYVAALRTGWSADNLRGAVAAKEELEWIEAEADDFLASLYDPLGRRGPITLPDGSKVPRIPGYTRWMWDGEFCGSIGLRWVPGAQDVPPYVLGHVGYAVVPWKRGRGYARQALEVNPAGGQGDRTFVCGDDHGPGERRISARHAGGWRDFGRPLHESRSSTAESKACDSGSYL